MYDSSSGSDSEGGDEQDDSFDMEGVSLRQPDLQPSPPASARRRGSVVNLGGRRMSVSVGAESQATLARMHFALAGGEVSEMQAALDSTYAVIRLADPAEAAEIHKLSLQITSRLSDGPAAQAARLKRSQKVRGQMQRLWDLMVATSARMAAGKMDISTTADVSRDGYTQVHARISKVLAAGTIFSVSGALAMANQDWAEDIARYSGTSHITVWLDAIRTKFRAAASRVVASNGYTALFAMVDADSSGEIDCTEFTSAVRNVLGIAAETVSGTDLIAVFAAVDADSSGEVDAKEFTDWLEGQGVHGKTKGPRLKKVDRQHYVLEEIKQRFQAASRDAVENLGWQRIFEKYDDDKSGELEFDEFSKAVRQECELSTAVVSDEQMLELFGVIDEDQSGAIDAAELQALLASNLDEASMTFSGFCSSIFELACVWVDDEEEDLEHAYSEFFKGLFNQISLPVDVRTAELITRLRAARIRAASGGLNLDEERAEVSWAMGVMGEIQTLDPEGTFAKAERVAGTTFEVVIDAGARAEELLHYVLEVLQYAPVGMQFILRPLDKIQSMVTGSNLNMGDIHSKPEANSESDLKPKPPKPMVRDSASGPRETNVLEHKDKVVANVAAELTGITPTQKRNISSVDHEKRRQALYGEVTRSAPLVRQACQVRPSVKGWAGAYHGFHRVQRPGEQCYAGVEDASLSPAAGASRPTTPLRAYAANQVRAVVRAQQRQPEPLLVSLASPRLGRLPPRTGSGSLPWQSLGITQSGAALLRRGCWAAPWQVRFAVNPPASSSSTTKRSKQTGGRRHHTSTIAAGGRRSTATNAATWWQQQRQALLAAGVPAQTSAQVQSARRARRAVSSATSARTTSTRPRSAW